ncbi:MAG: hypothetical protein JWQ45_1433 [Blastococcus sp.]|jgi:hypothetical protein|nr:hypothetical protein [Blastococcus sp.]
MPQHAPEFPFGFPLPKNVAAHIRATAAAVERPRRPRLAPMVWRSDDRSAD